MNDRIRITLIEDHEMVRAGFQMLLEAQPDMEIVAQADSGEAGLALMEEVEPDVVLLDISMPGMGGAETARNLKARYPAVRILAVTIHSNKAYLLEMLDAGVDGYLPKRAAAQELVNAVRAVYAGRTYIYTGLIDALVEGYRTRTEEAPDERGSEELTPRQREVLRLIADGLTSQRIADELELSVRTVDRHVENMMNRLGIHSRIELVKYAIREGLIEVTD
jgi:two-component system response regulator NreC